MIRKSFLLLTPVLLLAAPNNPSNLVLTPSTNTVSISWSDNSNDETGFKIFRDGSFIAVVGENTTSYLDENLKKETTYTYIVKASDDKYYKNILFAHGYKGSASSWDTFASYIIDNQKEWNVYRYSVGKEDSISVRATQLANYINNETNIADNTLVAVAHSMGGLDLRYIVSLGHKNQEDKTDIFYKASKKIHNIYTLATPHKGINDVGIDDATDDMTVPQMKIFNEANPYSIFSIEERRIPLLAYRFACDDERTSDGSGSESDGGNDGLLKVKTQIFNGAPHTQSVFSAKHTDDTLCLGSFSHEKERTDILQSILDEAQPYIDQQDIVFFKDAGCKGDESAVFSSTYKVGGVNCRTNDSCENNEISSLMLFPSIKKESLIELYNDASDDASDDWAVIDIANATLTKPLCISSFETELSDEVRARGITMQFHEVSGSGLDGKVSFIKVH